MLQAADFQKAMSGHGIQPTTTAARFNSHLARADPRDTLNSRSP
jgi:hypothetical protein